MKKVVLDKKYNEFLNNILKREFSTKKRLKAKVILLLSENKCIKQIIDETKLSKRTIINYKNRWNKENLLFIHKNNYNKSILEKHLSEIRTEFNENIANSFKDAAKRIKKMWNIQISPTQVRVFFIKHKLYTKNTIYKKDIPKFNSVYLSSQIEINEQQKNVVSTNKVPITNNKILFNRCHINPFIKKSLEDTFYIKYISNKKRINFVLQLHISNSLLYYDKRNITY